MQTRANRTRQLLLKAAAEAFDDHGYRGTRLQDVVAGRGISKGALYFHFASKERLAAAIVMEQRDLLSRLSSELRDRHPRAIQRLIVLSLRTAGMLQDDPMVRASTRLACESHHIGAAIPPLFDHWTDTVRTLLDEAGTQGDLLPEVDTGLVAEFIIAAIIGLRRTREDAKNEDGIARHVMEMWRLLLPGLAVRAHLPEIMQAIDTYTRQAYRQPCRNGR
ncbi:TetR family transcriptional regulator [Microtetraspora sp. NBRC 13810]|uniref:ScbR family autoregulator-binding transcription factor n=1 Tax=Microtetraspora sp. NBRC 13810 TaxID=3030990 RepID=UPI0024A3913F|nr:ScbR family autoregulator-binding transcription factor [Microtetraspora sp. NBRC 13810]GLW05805.1 TetR family transcriptional regulator [Microtetraspora sp. NBRC 13810]